MPGEARFAPIYPDEMGLFDKIDTIARRIYRADGAIADKKIRDQLKAWEEAATATCPVCMAKTQNSFSTDPNLRGAPTGIPCPSARCGSRPGRASSWRSAGRS